MKSGDLHKRIEFQAPTESSDGFGGITTSWVTQFKKWTAVKPENWSEGFRNNQDMATVRGVLTVRSDPQTRLITSKYRAVYDSRVFNITGLADVNEAKRQISLAYEESI